MTQVETSVVTPIIETTEGVVSILNPVVSQNNHNLLGGLQGGQANEYYHLTADEYSKIPKLDLLDGITSVSQGTANNDKLVTQGYVDDNEFDISTVNQDANWTGTNAIIFGDGVNQISIYQDFPFLKVILPSNDNSHFFRVENSDGVAVFSVSSDGRVQAEGDNGFWLTEAATFGSFLYLDTDKNSLIYETTGNINIENKASGKDINLWMSGDNDGSSSLKVLNSDISTKFSVDSSGYIFGRNEISSTGMVDFFNFASQGTDNVIGITSHGYAGKNMQLDQVSDQPILTLANAANSINRPDWAPGRYGQGQHLNFIDENGLFFRTFGTNREWNWLSGTWLFSNNASGADPAFHWRCYGANTTYYRWQTLNCFVDIEQFLDSTNNGIAFISGNTATAGLKLEASNGKLVLAASGNINILKPANSITTETLSEYITIEVNGVVKKLALVA